MTQLVDERLQRGTFFFASVTDSQRVADAFDVPCLRLTPSYVAIGVGTRLLPGDGVFACRQARHFLS